jgi:hypothetical protein
VWHNLAKAIRDLERTYSAALDPYRPELHYMRGPGPKWHAKRARAAANTAEQVAEEARALGGIAGAHA